MQAAQSKPPEARLPKPNNPDPKADLTVQALPQPVKLQAQEAQAQAPKFIGFYSYLIYKLPPSSISVKIGQYFPTELWL